MHQDISTSRRTHPVRTAVAVTSLALGAAMVVAPLSAGAAESDPTSTTTASTTTTTAPGPTIGAGSFASANGLISIVDETAPSNAACISQDEAFGPLFPQWQAYPESTDTQFIVKVTGQKPLCSPVATTAAIYKMPSTGEWPQYVGESLTHQIQNPGTITFTFTKECERVQYDVLAGASAPSPIYTGLDHQLLFPIRLDTALQYFGSSSICQPTTVAPTTVAPTTPETTAPPTTAAVLSSTTIPADVLAATTVPGGVSSNRNGSSDGRVLAATGSSSLPMTAAGFGLVAVGAGLIATRRRKLSA